jgi:1,4-dihydroxy-2-naphthoyl-CoA hydrolase
MSDIDPARMLDLEHGSAFVTAAGLHLTHVAADRVEGFIDLGPAHHQPYGIVHGGVYASAVETSASIGATVAALARGQIAVGVHNSTDFIRCMTTGRVSVTATPVQQGRTQQLWEVTITDDQGRLVARGSLRLQNVDRRA